MRCSAKGCRKKAVYWIKENWFIDWYLKTFRKTLSPEFFVCEDHTAVEAFLTRPKITKIKGVRRIKDGRK